MKLLTTLLTLASLQAVLAQDPPKGGEDCDACKQADTLPECTLPWVDAIAACQQPPCNRHYLQDPRLTCTAVPTPTGSPTASTGTSVPTSVVTSGPDTPTTAPPPGEETSTTELPTVPTNGTTTNGTTTGPPEETESPGESEGGAGIVGGNVVMGVVGMVVAMGFGGWLVV